MRARRRIASVLAGLVGAALLGGCGIPDPGGGPAISTTPRVAPLVSTNDLPVTRADEVHLFGFNNLHGNLPSPGGTTGRIAGYDAGGAAYLATHLARLKAAYSASAVVAAGDNIGASPPGLRAVPRRADNHLPEQHRGGRFLGGQSRIR